LQKSDNYQKNWQVLKTCELNKWYKEKTGLIMVSQEYRLTVSILKGEIQ